MNTKTIRRYSELIKLHSFEERFEYLKLNGVVSEKTFGFDRWLNQTFYNSSEWKPIRRKIILRDNGCDLGVAGYDISGKIIVHHINPISIEDIVNVSEYLMNPDYLITVSANTHNALHYGDPNLLKIAPLYLTERKPNDMCPWKN